MHHFLKLSWIFLPNFSPQIGHGQWGSQDWEQLDAGSPWNRSHTRQSVREATGQCCWLSRCFWHPCLATLLWRLSQFLGIKWGVNGWHEVKTGKMRFSSRAQLLCFSLMLTFTAGLAEERKILSREKRCEYTVNWMMTHYGLCFSVLGLFNLIQFPNTICNDTDNRSQGICYTRNECNSLGGNPKGECASGFGVCCICKDKFTFQDSNIDLLLSVEYTCQNMRSQAMDVVYFQNRGFPDETTVPEICIFSFSIRDPAICQLRWF